MAGTTVAVMIFLCGVWVGRGVPNDRGVGSDTSEASVATTPPAAAEPDDELSYAKRLQADSAPAEKLKSPAANAPAAAPKETSRAATPAPKPAAPPPAQTEAKAKPEQGAPQMSARAGAWIVQVVS